MSLPLVVYRDFVREHRSGLSNLSFGAWLGEQAKALGFGLVYVFLMELGIVIAVGFAVVNALFERLARRLPRLGVRGIGDTAGLPLVFYDHPSGRTRILNAMRWKAEHPDTWALLAPAGGLR